MTGLKKPSGDLLWKIAYIALGAAAAWLFFRYVFSWVLPFLLAVAAARLIEPPVRLLIKKLRFKRALAAALCTLLLYAAILGVAYAIVYRLVYEAGQLMRALPGMLSGLPKIAGQLQDKLYALITAVPEEIGKFLTSTIEGFLSRGIELPTGLYTFLANFLSQTVLSLPRILLFASACLLSTYFFSRDMEQLTGFLLKKLSQSARTRLATAKVRLISTLGKWLYAQAILMGLTFVETAVGLALARVEYFLLPALAVAFVDALPVVGAGTVLVPWGIVNLFTGQPARGVTILLLFVVVSTVRSFMEPRLVGKHIGLHPLLTLIAMYVGFRVIGVWGMLFFPIGAIILKQFYEWGYLKPPIRPKA